MISYLSVVDNASGDGAYLEAVNGMPAYTEPLDWTIDFTVMITKGTTGQLTMTVDDNDPEVFTDLSSGAQVTLESHVGFFEMCYTIDVTADAGQSARVSIDLDVASNRGDTTGGTFSTWRSGSFTIDRCQLFGPAARIDP